MKTITHKLLGVSALAMILITAGTAFGQTATSIPDGQEAKILGVITARSADSIVVATLDNSMSYNVMLTGAT
ncbi:MAG TPA: hypothetical protein VJV05_07120, partial [Pyrinomonadaceae bacterium]|nr:hypothetical protein [Pyrinomonadaceae bacterium]